MTLRAQLIFTATALAYTLGSTAHAQAATSAQCMQQTFPPGVKSLEDLTQSQSPSARSQTLQAYLQCLQGAGGNGNAPPPVKQAKAELTQTNSQSSFLGLNWGLGVGYAFGQGPKRVTATVTNNIVRVTSDVTDGPRVFLEAHYFPEKFTGNAGDFGWGPFATVEAGAAGTTSSNGISGFGLGLMAGWRVLDNKSSGFNIGIGYLWEGNVQTLGDGIVANQPLPAGETQVRYKNQSVGAVALMFSWTFGSSVPSSTSSSN